MSNLKSRITALEQNVPTEWLVLSCKNKPTDEQVAQMELAYNRGQFAIIIIERGDTVWVFNMPKPWEKYEY